MTYAAQEKYELAEQPFRRACEIDPKEPDACYYWARTLYSLSRFEAALRAYEKDAKPWRGKTLLGMALALEALDRDSEAENLYREAIRAGDKQAVIDYEKFGRKRPRGRGPIARNSLRGGRPPDRGPKRSDGTEASHRDDDRRCRGARFRR